VGIRWKAGAGVGGSEEDGWLTGEADVDDEGAALVGAVGGRGDGAGEVGDVSAVVQRDGDARDLPVAVALGELLLHARDVHHRRRRHLLEPREMGGRRRAGRKGMELEGDQGTGAATLLVIIRPRILLIATQLI